MLFQFVKQEGFNYAYNNTTPGSMANQSLWVLNRWKKPGDIANTQLYTTTYPGSPIYYYYSSASDGAISDASFIRLKNAALSYNLPTKWSRRIKAELVRFYLEGQNLVTWTKFKGGDPEIKSTSILPPLKVFAAGIQITF